MMYEVYGTSNCSFCDRAKSLLKEYDEPFAFIDVATNKSMMEAFLNRFPGVSKVPQIVLGEEHIGGYDQLRKRLTYDRL